MLLFFPPRRRSVVVPNTYAIVCVRVDSRCAWQPSTSADFNSNVKIAFYTRRLIIARNKTRYTRKPAPGHWLHALAVQFSRPIESYRYILSISSIPPLESFFQFSPHPLGGHFSNFPMRENDYTGAKIELQ